MDVPRRSQSKDLLNVLRDALANHIYGYRVAKWFVDFTEGNNRNADRWNWKWNSDRNLD